VGWRKGCWEGEGIGERGGEYKGGGVGFGEEWIGGGVGTEGEVWGGKGETVTLLLSPAHPQKVLSGVPSGVNNDRMETPRRNKKKLGRLKDPLVELGEAM